MAGDYTDIISRDSTLGGTVGDPLVPTPVSAQIIQSMVQKSAVLSNARRVPMSSKTDRIPVLDVLPTAYFVGTGQDTGLAQTSKQAWENQVLIAEKLAVIVPIPNDYLDDAQVPLWDEVSPRVSEAFGRATDQACLFGINKPSTWGQALVPEAVARGNHVTQGTNDDLAADVAEMSGLVAKDGFAVTAFASGPGLRWALIGLRSAQGLPIYAPPYGTVSEAQPGTLYGYPLNETLNGGWDPTQAVIVGGDWSNALLGVRADIEMKIFSEGVITDASGAVVINLMQQDAVAARFTMRLAWAVADPATPLNANAHTRWPFGVVDPVGS